MSNSSTRVAAARVSFTANVKEQNHPNSHTVNPMKSSFGLISHLLVGKNPLGYLLQRFKEGPST